MAEPTHQKNENALKKEQVKVPAPQAAGLDNETAAAIAEVVPRAVADPGRLRPSEVLTLQRKTGNRAVVRLLSQVQPKLIVGAAFDPLEAEADRTADRVLSIPEAVPAKPTSPAPQGKMQREALEDDEEEIQAMSLKPAPVALGKVQPFRLQRAAAEEEEVQTMRVQRAAAEEEEVQTLRVQRAAAEEEEVQTLRVQRAADEEEEVQTLRVQRAADEEEEVQTLRVQRAAGEEEEVQTLRVQRAADEEEEVQTLRVQRAADEEEEIQTAREGKPFDPMDRFDPGSAVEDQIRSQAGGGEPLPGEIRSYMEPRFGADFSGVRIHTGSGAAKLNRQISARAFTFGKDIYLGEGSFAPASSDGRRLLAHELTHTIQQTGGVQRLTATAESLKKVSLGDPGLGFGILSDIWFDLVEAVEGYERSVLYQNAENKKTSLNDIIKLCNKFTQFRKTKETTKEDNEKAETVQALLNDALVEIGAVNEEEGFTKRTKEDSESTAEKLNSRGKDLLKNATNTKGAHTVEAAKGAQADLYGSVVERARNLNALLAVKGDSKAAERFEMIVELLSGGGNIASAYEKVKAATPGSEGGSLDDNLASFAGNISEETERPDLTAKYLQARAKTGSDDPQYELLLHLGVISPRKAENSEQAMKVVTSYISTDLLTKKWDKTEDKAQDSAKRDEEVAALKAKINDLNNFLKSNNIPVINRLDTATGKDWKDAKPWKSLDSDYLRMIEATFRVAENAVSAGEKLKPPAEDEKNVKPEVLEARKQEALGFLVESSIDRLMDYIKSMRSSVYTGAEGEKKIMTFIREWKEQTSVLEQKYGFAPNFIGDKIISEKRLVSKGLGKSNLSLAMDIITGTIGSQWNRVFADEKGKSQKEAGIQSEGSARIHQAIRSHHDDQTVTTGSDVDELANDLVKIGSGDPKALLAYLLDLLGEFKPFGKLTTADFEPPKKDAPPTAKGDKKPLTPEDKNKAIAEAFKKLEEKLEIRKLAKERMQVMQERRASLEKIVAIFRYGGNVLEEGKVYVAVRQALTERSYRNKAMLKAMADITDKDRAMIKADLELRKYMAEAVAGKDEAEDKKKIEGILGFSLASDPKQGDPAKPEQAELFVGGKSAKTGADLDVKSIAEPKGKDGKIDYESVAARWAATILNSFQASQQEAYLKQKAADFLAWLPIVGGPNAKGALTAMHETQGSIRKMVESDPDQKGKVDGKVKDVILRVSGQIPNPAWDEIGNADEGAKRWLTGGIELPMSGLISKGRGAVGTDDAFIIKAIRDASAADLISTIADTDQFFSLFGAFQAQIAAVQSAKDKKDKDLRIERVRELQTHLLAFAPGVKLSFIQYLQDSWKVNASQQRLIVEAAQNKLADSFKTDPAFRDKVDEVRAKIAELDDQRKASSGAVEMEGKSDPTASFGVGKMKDKMTENEANANAAMLNAQTHMQDTRAHQGSNAFNQGNKSAMEQGKSEMIGSAREVVSIKGGAQHKDTDAKLGEKTKELEKKTAEFEKRKQTFVKQREAIKGYIKLALKVIFLAISTGITLGFGAAAAVPIWIKVLQELTEKAVNTALEYWFDPQKVTLGEVAWDTLSAVITTAMVANDSMISVDKTKTTYQKIVTSARSAIDAGLHATVFKKSQAEADLDQAKLEKDLEDNLLGSGLKEQIEKMAAETAPEEKKEEDKKKDKKTGDYGEGPANETIPFPEDDTKGKEKDDKPERPMKTGDIGEIKSIPFEPAKEEKIAPIIDIGPYHQKYKELAEKMSAAVEKCQQGPDAASLKAAITTVADAQVVLTGDQKDAASKAASNNESEKANAIELRDFLTIWSQTLKANWAALRSTAEKAGLQKDWNAAIPPYIEKLPVPEPKPQTVEPVKKPTKPVKPLKKTKKPSAAEEAAKLKKLEERFNNDLYIPPKQRNAYK